MIFFILFGGFAGFAIGLYVFQKKNDSLALFGTFVVVGMILGGVLFNVAFPKEVDTRCTICGKKSTTMFQGSYYCDEDYRDAVKWVEDNSNTSYFTNKYGTSTTKCIQDGCNNYIANSGDTNACEEHSNECLNCHCYIDGDAMYCMSCLSEALGD